MPTDQEAIPADDFARERVPDEKTSSGLHLGLIIVGGTIGFAIFIVAGQIGGSLGYAKAAMAFGLGSLILGGMGAITSYVGARSRYSTYLLTEFAFGQQGAKLANLAVAISLIGWYGVISNTLGMATQQMLMEVFGFQISPYISVTIASCLMITVTIMGFTGIDKLALVLVPVMALFILFAAFRALSLGNSESFEPETVFTFSTAVSAVVGSYIAGVIIQPDYSRFAVNARQAVWSVFIALGLIFPLVQFFSAVPSMAMGEPSIVTAMTILGLIIPAFFLLFLGAWSSNVLCLYSASLSIATIATRFRLPQIILAVGVVGTALAFVPAQEYLIDFLVLLGIAIPPIGAIYIVDAMFIRRFDLPLAKLDQENGFRLSALVAWSVAVAVGYASDAGLFAIVGVASLDSLITATIVFSLFERRSIR